MKKTAHRHISVYEAATRLGFSPDHIRRMILQGKIKATKVGYMWILLEKDIEHVVRKRKSPLKETV